jgi:hypothetical protein
MASRTGDGLRLRLRRSSIVLRIKLIILVNSELVIVEKLVDVISFLLDAIMIPEIEIRVSESRSYIPDVYNMTPDLRRK